jgi:hypothetical protein
MTLVVDLRLDVPIAAALTGSGALSATLEVTAGVTEVPIAAALTGTGTLTAALGVPSDVVAPTSTTLASNSSLWFWTEERPWRPLPVVVYIGRIRFSVACQFTAHVEALPSFRSTYGTLPLHRLSSETRDLLDLAALGYVDPLIALDEAERELQEV